MSNSQDQNPVPAGNRQCPCCMGIFPASEFNRDRQKPDGLRIYCKPCDWKKAGVAARKRRDLIAAGKRMTNPNTTSDERQAAYVAGLGFSPHNFAAIARVGSSTTTALVA